VLKAQLVKTVQLVLKVLRARLVLKVQLVKVLKVLRARLVLKVLRANWYITLWMVKTVKTERLDPKEMSVQLVLMDKMGRLVPRAIQEKKELLDPREYKV
tara:strand:- start:39 stop:338 length:300 start_codon:yes stop_codon:yes gene_type:complete